MASGNLALELQSFQSDFIFFQKDINNLRNSYLNKFVAVKNCKVIAFGNSIEEIKTKLEIENIEPSQTVIEFVPEEESILIL